MYTFTTGTGSDTIVLGTKQVLVAKQHAMTLQVDKVGMFLCRMDRFEDNRLRILDDFSIQTSLDMKSQGKDVNMDASGKYISLDDETRDSRDKRWMN